MKFVHYLVISDVSTGLLACEIVIGLDMLYCHNRFDMINELYKEGIPCLGHMKYSNMSSFEIAL